MLENNQTLPDVRNKEEVMLFLSEVGKAFGDAIKKHPQQALFIGGILGGLYVLKDKNIKFHLKKSDLEIDFETEKLFKDESY